ncbi:MAG: hypothetical protein FWC95_06110 [Defluviitaleaceae bacterium]|nr:hypothetical protein [Defluviitaleaceae bacterium]
MRAVAIGNFDGVHTGHRVLLDRLKTEAATAGLAPAVVSFDPHPLKVIGSHVGSYKTLLTNGEKKEIITNLDIEYIDYPFTGDTSLMLPEVFFFQVLMQEIKAMVVVVGEGFRFGNGGSGNVVALNALAVRYGIKVFSVPHINMKNKCEKISTSVIKQLISQKKFKKAAEMLQYEYFVTIINGVVSEDKLIPPDGIYAVNILHNGKRYTEREARVENNVITTDFNTDDKGYRVIFI